MSFKKLDLEIAKVILNNKTTRQERRKFAKSIKKSIKKKVSFVEDDKTAELTPFVEPPKSVVLSEPNRDITQLSLIEQEKIKRNFVTGEEWARQDIEWLSNSSINIPNFLWFMKYIILREHKRKMERSARMEWGKHLGEWGGLVATGYCNIDQAWKFIEDSSKRYIPSTVSAVDGEANEYYLTFGKKMLQEIVYQLLFQKQKGETIQLERPVFYVINGVNIMWTGFIDIAYVDSSGILKHWTELKTSYPSAGGFYKRDYKDKNTGDIKPEGSRIWKYPSSPNEPKSFHLSQMAIYAHAENMLGDMLYVNAKESRFFEHDCYQELQWDRLKQEIESIKDKAMVRQTLLQMSDDPLKIIKLVPPEYDHMFFKNIEPQYKQMIYDIYNNNKKAN